MEEPALDVREALQQVLPERRHLVDLPVARRLVDDLDVRVIRQGLVETLRPALRSGVGELSLGVNDLPLAAHCLEQLIGDGRSHVDVVRLEEGQVPKIRKLLRILDEPGVHIDQRDASGDDLVRRIDQRVAGRRMDGDEVEALRRDRLQVLQLLLDGELTVEGGDLDAQQVAEELGRLHTVRDPGRGRADLGGGGGVLLLGKVLGQQSERGQTLRRGDVAADTGRHGERAQRGKPAFERVPPLETLLQAIADKLELKPGKRTALRNISHRCYLHLD